MLAAHVYRYWAQLHGLADVVQRSWSRRPHRRNRPADRLLKLYELERRILFDAAPVGAAVADVCLDVQQSPDAGGPAADSNASSMATTASSADTCSAPIAFEQNVGQTDSLVDFIARGSGYTIFLTDGDAVLRFGTDHHHVLRLDLIDARSDADATAEGLLIGTSSYLVGNDPSEWYTDLANYQSVLYEDIYEGIDVRYYGNERQLEYDFVVHPGADLRQIRLNFQGAEDVSLTADGDLVLRMSDRGEAVYFASPVTYQEFGGNRIAVNSSYAIAEDGTVAFHVDNYDTSRTLVIDPVVSYAAFVGGSVNEAAHGIAVDSSGNSYITGYTSSSDFPGNQLGSNSGNFDVFVLKRSSDGATQLYSVYFGGSSNDEGRAIAIDGAGNAYITGYTQSSNFSTTSNAYAATLNGGQDIFIAKINAAGNALDYSSYLGGINNTEEGRAIAVDSSGKFYATGITNSPGSGTLSDRFPITSGVVDSSSSGSSEAFVVKFDPTLSGSASLIYSSFLGGSGEEGGNALSVDSGGNVYVGGYTSSNDFTIINGFDSTFAGAWEGFVARINSTATAITYSTYLGGTDTSWMEQVTGLALNASNHVFVVGQTNAADFSTTAGAYDQTHNGDQDAFLVKLDPSQVGASSRIYSTFIGGNSTDYGTAVAIDDAGRAVFVGHTESSNLPVTGDATDSTLNSKDAFLGVLNAAGSGLDYLTYLGNSQETRLFSVDVNSTAIFAAGETLAATLQNVSNSINAGVSGGNTALLVKYSLATPGITVSPTSGLATTEAGGTGQFTVVLNTQPTANVTISISSGDLAEGTVSASSLTFTSANWNTPQTVTVTGVNDAVDDGDIAYAVITGAASSTDANYNGINPNDVSLTNTDNDTAGITITPTNGLWTTEGGGTAQFTVVLDTQPTASVTVGIASGDTSEGTVSASFLTFTTVNWNVPRTITVTGVDDALGDGNIAYTVITSAGSRSDAIYDALNPTDVSLTSIDNESAGITVIPTIALTTTEAGGVAQFIVVLNKQPTADVTFSVSSGDSTEGITSVSSLTFTTANWNSAQTVTVAGVDDSVDDGNITYSVITGTASSTDISYDGLNATDVSLTNTDNDTAGITVIPTSGLTTSEAGGTAQFTVVLNSQPTADVTININSGDTSEGTASVSSLIFTAANWSVVQTVTVTGVDDVIDDGDIAYTVITGAASSGDANYNGFNPVDVGLTNTDNDTAGITVIPTNGLTTTEAGGTAQFTVVLNSQPAANVTININSGDISEGTVSASSLTFTTANWNLAQTVTVTGIDDVVDDGDIVYTVITGAATSTDASYGGLNATDVSLTNTDNDIAGITIIPTSGLTTTEAGATAQFTVVLNSQPTANVTIAIDSGDTSEGTVSVSALTFTSANWNLAQTVTVTGVDDAVDDGDVAYTVITGAASSGDANYNGFNPIDVSLINTDNDTAGIIVIPTNSLITTEGGFTAQFTVVLNSQPTANVTIAIDSSDTSEGTVSVSSLTFTSANWNVAQSITVSGMDDQIADGEIIYSVITGAASSVDASYNGLNPTDVSLSNVDNDSAGFFVSPTSGLTTNEAGGTAQFTVALNNQPTANVTISVASSNASEGTASVTFLTFTSANWNLAQNVTVTGVNDVVDDGDVVYTVIIGSATSTDVNYNGINPADVSLTNIDNDTAGVLVSPTSGLITTEVGGTAQFTAVLNSQPTANVTISVDCGDASEGSVSVSSLTFTSSNWNVAQTVTVTGVNDEVDDGDIAYAVITGAASSADARYNGLNPMDVSLTNSDNDSAGLIVSLTSGLTTTEAGGAALFTVMLASQPTANVTINVNSGNASEGTVSVNSLTFTSSNWSLAQTVTVTGVDDAVDDDDIAYSVVTGSANSADTGYNGINPADVSLTNIDDDTAGITVNPTSGLTTTESGGTAQFTVVLNSQPTADVIIALRSSNLIEGTTSVRSVIFTAVDWNTPQSITVTGVDDQFPISDTQYSVLNLAATSADAKYNGVDPDDVSLINLDDDSASVRVFLAHVASDEPAATAARRALSDQFSEDSSELLDGLPSEGGPTLRKSTAIHGNGMAIQWRNADESAEIPFGTRYEISVNSPAQPENDAVAPIGSSSSQLTGDAVQSDDVQRPKQDFPVVVSRKETWVWLVTTNSIPPAALPLGYMVWSVVAGSLGKHAVPASNRKADQ